MQRRRPGEILRADDGPVEAHRGQRVGHPGHVGDVRRGGPADGPGLPVDDPDPAAVGRDVERGAVQQQVEVGSATAHRIRPWRPGHGGEDEVGWDPTGRPGWRGPRPPRGLRTRAGHAPRGREPDRLRGSRASPPEDRRAARSSSRRSRRAERIGASGGVTPGVISRAVPASPSPHRCSSRFQDPGQLGGLGRVERLRVVVRAHPGRPLAGHLDRVPVAPVHEVVLQPALERRSSCACGCAPRPGGGRRGPRSRSRRARASRRHLHPHQRVPRPLVQLVVEENPLRVEQGVGAVEAEARDQLRPGEPAEQRVPCTSEAASHVPAAMESVPKHAARTARPSGRPSRPGHNGRSRCRWSSPRRRRSAGPHGPS